MSDLDSLIQIFRTAFYSDDLKTLLSTYSQFQKLNENSNINNQLQNFTQYKKFEEDLSSYQRCSELLGSQNWQKVLQDPQILIEVRRNSHQFLTRSSLLIRENIFKVLSLISQIDLVPQWQPISRVGLVSQVEILQNISHIRKQVKYSFWFPQPLSERTLRLETVAFPVLDSEGVLIILKTPSNAQREESSIRVELGCLYCEPITKNLTRLVCLIEAYSGLDRIPNWLRIFGEKRVMYHIMDDFKTQLQGFQNEEHARRVELKREFYEFMSNSLMDLAKQNT